MNRFGTSTAYLRPNLIKSFLKFSFVVTTHYIRTLEIEYKLWQLLEKFVKNHGY